MELEQASTSFKPVDDRRPKLVAPPPVRLAAVADVVLPCVAGLEKEMDDFYAGLFRFEPEESGTAYRAENFRLRFVLLERPESRQDYRALGIIVPSLADLIDRLIESEIEYTRHRGISAGMESLLLSDPAGNLVEATEARRIL